MILQVFRIALHLYTRTPIQKGSRRFNFPALQLRSTDDEASPVISKISDLTLDILDVKLTESQKRSPFSGGIKMLSARLVFVCLVAGTFAMGQQGRGTILGTVTDSSAASIQNARVVVTNIGTNLDYPTTTSSEGYYTVPNLPVGEYRITVSA